MITCCNHTVPLLIKHIRELRSMRTPLQFSGAGYTKYLLELSPAMVPCLLMGGGYQVSPSSPASDANGAKLRRSKLQTHDDLRHMSRR